MRKRIVDGFVVLADFGAGVGMEQRSSILRQSWPQMDAKTPPNLQMNSLTMRLRTTTAI